MTKYEFLPREQGYYTVIEDGHIHHKLMSVTNALELIPAPYLRNWQIGMGVDYIIDKLNQELIGPQELEYHRKEAIGAAKRYMQERGQVGTDVHQICEEIIKGQFTPHGELLRTLYPTYEQSFRNWIKDYNPIFEACEMTVFNIEDGYSGTFDALTKEGDEYVLWDWKTSNSLQKKYRIQTEAYRRAPYGFLNFKEHIEMPKIARCNVLHLHPKYAKKGGYKVVPMKATDEDYELLKYLIKTTQMINNFEKSK